VSAERWTLVRNARQLLTLQGATGPRRGAAMSELHIVPNGALLIRNGIIEHVGPARRVENLTGARMAREVDATGKVVMPAFIDADVALVPGAPTRSDGEPEGREESASLRLMSRKRVLTRAAAMSAECAKYGTLAVGAHTRGATDLQNTGKVLRAHQALQLKPLRIRSIFAPQFPAGSARTPAQLLELLTAKWLPTVRTRKLSAVVEFTVAGGGMIFDNAMLRAAAIAAAGLGYAIRLRSEYRLEPIDLQLALSAGAIGIVAPMDTLRAFTGPLAAVGCVRVIPASEGFEDAENAGAAIRSGINEGAAIAVTSSYRAQAASSINMQYLLHLAVHRLGLTAEEAIVATTWNAACSLRLSHVAGSLEPGKEADLVMMDVPDYRELARRAGHHDVNLVMRKGQVIVRGNGLSAGD
jgi:imidazolonepropionase